MDLTLRIQWRSVRRELLGLDTEGFNHRPNYRLRPFHIRLLVHEILHKDLQWQIDVIITMQEVVYKAHENIVSKILWSGFYFNHSHEMKKIIASNVDY